ncbi:hypothetical protein M436DRAFT_33452, partial [Aureobasidium namibiae CBS 147.97]
LRKGTKSCAECKRRKVRCVWPADTTQVCSNCQIRDHPCSPQTLIPSTDSNLSVSESQRTRVLEDEVNLLWAAVRSLEATLTSCARAQSVSLPISEHNRSEAPVEQSDHTSRENNLSHAHPRCHLHQLLDTHILDSQGTEKTWQETEDQTSLVDLEALNHSARRDLQPLLPARSDVVALSAHSFVWSRVYTSLFPGVQMTASAEDMLDHYNEACKPDIDARSVANLLLSLALTVRQIPAEDLESLGLSMCSPAAFPETISVAVHRVVLVEDALAATLEGIETSLLFIRLSLACVNIKRTWLQLRRIVALAEMIGLPRTVAHLDITNTSLEQLRRYQIASDLWEGICMLDRFAGTMFGLPTGTGSYRLSPPKPLLRDGKVVPQVYLRYLTDMALQIQTLDESSAAGKSDISKLAQVHEIHKALEDLALSTPEGWFASLTSYLSADHMLQFWHQYLVVRTHLCFALQHDDAGRYGHHYNACIDACRSMIWRYVTLRPLIPSGISLCRVLDFQVMTAAMFILWTYSETSAQVVTTKLPQQIRSADLFNQLLPAMKTASDRPGGDFAHKAAIALCSLNSYMCNEDLSQESLTLRIPMLGIVTVRRRPALQKHPGS